MKPQVLFIGMIGEADVHDPDDFADLPDSGDDRVVVKNRLREWGVLEQIDLHLIDISWGDALPEPDAFDAVIIGGTVHSVYEDKGWQIDLKAWLQRWRETGRPALGICGGHQMMSVMNGGTVETRVNGPMGCSAAVDVSPAAQSHPLFDGFDEAPWFHFGNYDHVVEVPDGAEVIATTDDSPAVALDFGGDWLSVQFHPEASHDVFSRIWLKIAPENMKNYRALPFAPRLLVNFLRLSRVIA